MRIPILAAALLVAAAGSNTATADPYRYCAEYGGTGDNGTNCYFMTLDQCRAALYAGSGFCMLNPFYDGRPVTTPGETSRRSRAPATR